jgi:Fic family protein
MYKPVFKITPYLVKLIDEASALREWVNSSTLKVAWLPALQREARIRATHSSTSIEGNPLNIPQIEKLIAAKKQEAKKDPEKEILNYLKAMRWIEAHSHSSINEGSILYLHSILMDGLLSKEKCGKYKEKQNYVTDENGIKIYTPPSPKDTPKFMGELVGWLNSRAANELHSIMACAILHHRLVSIHPFSDGNGRIARLLGIWLLYRRDFDLRHIFSLDDFFASDRKRYYEKIQQARELDDNLTCWIEYAAEGIVKTLKEVKKRIEGLQIRSKTKINLSLQQEAILSLLRDQGSLPVSEIMKQLKVSRARVNQIIHPLIKDKIILMEGKARATRYNML